MATDQSVSMKDTIYKLQLALLEGIKNEEQLFAAGSLMCRSDYEDVVVERSIAKLCGYPLCCNSLTSDQPQKGRYRISLKEHKVYDLHETCMYCSSKCIVNSRAFARSLQEERCLVQNTEQLNEILRKFGSLSVDSENLGENGDLGLSNLKIQEKMETNVGEVPFEEWIGPSNAIEGYVPQRDRDSKTLPLKNHQEGSTAISTKQAGKSDSFFKDMDFTSVIITNDEYSISKAPTGATKPDSFFNDMDFTSVIITNDEYSISKAPTGSTKPTANTKSHQKGRNSHKGLKGQPSSSGEHDSVKTSSKSKGQKSKKVIKDQLSDEHLPSPSNFDAVPEEKSEVDKEPNLSKSMLKPSLKSSGAKKFNRSVTWADEKVDNAGIRNLCDVRKMKEIKGNPEVFDSVDMGDDGNNQRFKSAEACAVALSQAAEAVASGDSDATDAFSEVGVIILPNPHDADQGDSIESVNMLERESASQKWPVKPGILQSELFDPEDSWYDAPPEGFSLALSPFATMWMALFAWVTSSSLAYIYGRDESSHEDYLSVNGREYPRKVVLPDGRSSEIKLTVEGCLGRALPGLVAELRLPIPVSTLEQGAALLLDTMSFCDALPAFRVKQWQVFAFLFTEALSVCRIPALTSYLTSRRMVLHQLLDGAQISTEEYEVMKDLMVPLGRVPQARSGA